MIEVLKRRLNNKEIWWQGKVISRQEADAIINDAIIKGAEKPAVQPIAKRPIIVTEIKSIKRVATSKSTILVDDVMLAARQQLCSTCEHNLNGKCKRLCGCGSPVDHIIKRPFMRCPIGKWERTKEISECVP